MNLNLAVFGSGNGSNCRAIVKAIDEKKLDAEVRLIISDQEQAGILAFARERGILSRWICREQHQTKDLYYNEMTALLRNHQVGFIVLAGYLRKIGKPLIDMYPDKIINIHPALLPSFGGKGMYGLRVHQAVIDAGVKVTGMTVHLVDEHYDHGPIVMQHAVAVDEKDTPESLSEKVLRLEHTHYHEAIRYFAENRCTVRNGKVFINHSQNN